MCSILPDATAKTTLTWGIGSLVFMGNADLNPGARGWDKENPSPSHPFVLVGRTVRRRRPTS